MSYEAVRAISMLVMFVVFVGIAVWAWSGAQRERFAQAARLPLEDELQ